MRASKVSPRTERPVALEAAEPPRVQRWGPLSNCSLTCRENDTQPVLAASVRTAVDLPGQRGPS